MSQIIIMYVLSYFGASYHTEPNDSVQPWQKYSDPTEAGFSEIGLRKVDSLIESSHASAAMLISEGHIVQQWGEIERRFMCHSVRKSLLNALYGVYITNGKIDISKTIEELGIEDKDTLSTLEKSATIEQLLSARSGVFHPAAYETPAMRQFRPDRNSKQPGEHWFYNNWDFNTLMTIFENETDEKFFEAFDKALAKPLGMQDFRIIDGYYHLEAHNSIHPAYPFKMSARDMAKIGQLFLNKGSWNGQQMISEDWIIKSTQQITSDLGRYEILDGYGLLWWVYDDIAGKEAYTAAGVGGQHITVIPELDIVYVQRVNTYEGKRVTEVEHESIVMAIIHSKSEVKSDKPLLTDMKESLKPVKVESLPDVKIKRSYTNKEIGIAEIRYSEFGPLVSFKSFGNFVLISGKDSWTMEDLEKPIYFRDSIVGGSYTLDTSNEEILKSITFYY